MKTVDGVSIALSEEAGFTCVCSSMEDGMLQTVLTPPLASVEDCKEFKQKFEKEHQGEGCVLAICQLNVLHCFLP